MYFSYYNGEKRQIQAFFCKSFLFCIWNYEKYGIYYRHNADLWCNGSTSDSGSLCWGSNPYRSAIFLSYSVSNPLQKASNCLENKFSCRCFFFLLCSFLPCKNGITHFSEVDVALLRLVGLAPLRRILTGLPFFCPIPWLIPAKSKQLPGKHIFLPLLFLFALFIFAVQKWDYSLFLRVALWNRSQVRSWRKKIGRAMRNFLPVQVRHIFSLSRKYKFWLDAGSCCCRKNQRTFQLRVSPRVRAPWGCERAVRMRANFCPVRAKAEQWKLRGASGGRAKAVKRSGKGVLWRRPPHEADGAYLKRN